MITLKNLDEFNSEIDKNEFVIIYFSHESCNVCKVLKPKIIALINESYPEIKLLYCNTVELPEIAGQNSVFAVPTIIAYVRGKEQFRRSRNIGISELKELIERPYSFIF
jgi:thioredoxin-like negative regulator of GroEL